MSNLCVKLLVVDWMDVKEARKDDKTNFPTPKIFYLILAGYINDYPLESDAPSRSCFHHALSLIRTNSIYQR